MIYQPSINLPATNLPWPPESGEHDWPNVPMHWSSFSDCSDPPDGWTDFVILRQNTQENMGLDAKTLLLKDVQPI